VIETDINHAFAGFLMDYLLAHKGTSLLSDCATQEEKMFENLYFLVAKVSWHQNVSYLCLNPLICYISVDNSYKNNICWSGKSVATYFDGTKTLVIRN